MLTCIEPNFWDHGGYYGQESEEGKEGKEISQEEKEVTLPTNIMHRIASEVSHAFLMQTGGSLL
jgi:hypothetical protein